MDYQNRSFIFFIYRSLSFFLYLTVILSIGLVGTVGAMGDTDPGLFLPTTLLHNLERPSPPPQNVQAQIQTQLSVLPLSFIPNAGQVDPPVLYTVTGHQSTLYFTPNEIVIAARENTGSEPITHVIRQTFPGANGNPVIAAEERLAGSANFYSGRDPSKWQTNVSTYGSVIYHDLYSGIDLRYTGTDGTLKREFIIAPGTSPATIRLHYEGIDSLIVDNSGSLIITSGNSTLTESPVVCYQDITGTRTLISAGYQVTGEQDVAFSLGEYNPLYPLVIDPSLVYSTYLGGSGGDYGDLGMGIAADSSGCAYVVGTTNSADFPTTSGAFNQTFGGPRDVFVTKLNPSGSSLMYSTYLGVSGDYPWNKFGIAVDSSGNAYVTGTTNSDAFPITSGAYNQTFGGNGDGFITKLNPSGSSLVYSTYLGGSGADYCGSIAVDSSGNAYVAGTTDSTNFPTTSDAFNRTFGGTSDVFVTKLNPSGSSLMYSTYLGGSSNDFGNDIAVDSSGDVYVTGYTYSETFPTTSGAYSRTFGGNNDVFIAKLNPSGSSLEYSTLLGGWHIDVGHSIAVDSGGNAYVTGYTYSNDFPTTAGAFNRTFGDQSYQDAFVTKLNPSGSSLVYSTYLGGQSVDDGYGIAVDSGGNAYVTGITHSGDFPTTNNAYNRAFGGTGDVFISKLNPEGSSLVYSTYLGGSGEDCGLDIAADNSGNEYVTGFTYSYNFPTTSGVYNRTYGGGGYDAFVAKMSTGPARTVSPVLVIPYGYLPTGTPVTAIFTINVEGLYPSDGEEQLFTDLEHPNWTYTIVVNGVENLRPIIEGSALTISGFELSYRPSDVVSVHVTLEGDAPALDPPLTNFTVMKVQSMDSNNDVVPGSVVTVGGQTTATHLPVTDFNATPKAGTAPLMVIFQDISTNYPSSWNWSFGDGTLFNYSGLVPRNPIHTYTFYGTYTVSLTTTNAMGSNTTTKIGYITVTNATTQIGVFRNSTGDWYLEYNKTGVVDKTFHFGKSGDIPVTGDWNKNGVPDYGVFRPSNGNWYLETTKSDIIYSAFHFGKSGDVPVAGDWDGNGFTDIGVFRPSNGNWYLETTKTGIVNTTFHFGKSGDIPVTGDWNSDGASDAGVFRPSNGNWYLETTKTGIVNTTFHFGKSGDIPVVGDWDGDEITDIGVFRPSNGDWYLDHNKTEVVDMTFHFGKAGDSPIAGSTSTPGPPLQPSKTITFNQNLTITPGTTVYIPVGGKVIWKNDDPLKPHGLAAVDAQGAKYFGGLTGVQIPYNNIFEVTFDTVGSFDYKTTFEPETTGRVIVTMY